MFDSEKGISSSVRVIRSSNFGYKSSNFGYKQCLIRGRDVNFNLVRIIGRPSRNCLRVQEIFFLPADLPPRVKKSA